MIGISFSFTVIVTDAVKSFTVVAVMVAVPSATAVTKPRFVTVATDVSLDDHVIDFFVASLGVMVAFNCTVAASVNEIDSLSKVIPVGYTILSL